MDGLVFEREAKSDHSFLEADYGTIPFPGVPVEKVPRDAYVRTISIFGQQPDPVHT